MSAAGGFGAGQGTLAESAVSSVFPHARAGRDQPLPGRLHVFAQVLASFSVPAFLSASDEPSGVALSGANAAKTAALAWGVNAAQTAAITDPDAVPGHGAPPRRLRRSAAGGES